MKESLFPEANFFAASFCTGVFLLAGYDLVLLFRLIIPHKKVMVILEDIIFWSFAGLYAFRMMYIMNFGIVRGFSVLTIAIGMFSYRAVRKLVQKPLKKPYKRLTMVLRKRKETKACRQEKEEAEKQVSA